MEYKPNFPSSLAAFKEFVSERLLNADKVDDVLCSSVIEKINRGMFEFSDAERSVMRAIVNIGIVCECDEDHRIGADNKTCEDSYL